MRSFDVLLCGVGGQGLVLLSRVMGTACAAAGTGIVTGEQHGLSQRSGSVSIHLRTGNPSSPLIPLASADAILALEALESLRYVEYLKPGGTVLTSTLVMHPVTETSRLVQERRTGYTGMEEVRTRLAGRFKLVEVPAREIASSLGSLLAENMVMLGALSALDGFPLDRAGLAAAAAEVLPPALLEVNLRALDAGISTAR